MSCGRCFYRLHVYLHVIIVLLDFALTFTLLMVIVTIKPDLFLPGSHLGNATSEVEPEPMTTTEYVIMGLFGLGWARTLILAIFAIILSVIIMAIPCCICACCCPKTICTALKSKPLNRCVSFNCNCPCYRSRPSWRFKFRFMFTVLFLCIRGTTIVLFLAMKPDRFNRNLPIIIAISIFFLILTVLLDYYYYRLWWRYKPTLIGHEDFKMPKTPLSKKHKRFIPYNLLGENRDETVGNKPCLKGSECQNRSLEHILIFHMSGHHAQPRYQDLEKAKPGNTRYIGFHQTDPESAILIAHSDFRISEKYESTMIGHGVYFARSRAGTERKANRKGAFICAEINMGRVLYLRPEQRNTYRGKKDWWCTYDTAYFCHEDASSDEFCVKSPDQIIKWIMVITDSDGKVRSYGLDREFDDTCCWCI